MVIFNYNEEDDIIYVERHGDIVLDDMIKYVDDIDNKYQRIGTLYIVDDMRNSATKFSASDNTIIVDEVLKRISKYDEVKCAVLVDKPLDTALSILYEYLSDTIENYSYKTFSTFGAAKEWLMKN